MKKVLVTGHKGFVGRNLVSELKTLSFIVDTLDLDDFYNSSNWHKTLNNLLDSKEYDTIFHIGACSNTLEDRVNFIMQINYEATKILVDWCVNNKKKIIYSSSAANYGNTNLYPSNLYGWSKYVAEGYVVSNGGIALRYFNVYGPGEEDKGKMASVAYQMYIKNVDGNDIYIFPNKPERDFVYIKDIINANLHAYYQYENLEKKFYEVGSGTPRTFEDVLDLMNIKYKYLNEDKIPDGYQFYTCSDKSKWMKNWTPIFSLEKGIHEYLIYLKNGKSKH